ncbi:hypothetical protein GNI_010560 [Gregarina niphandrodes]|uniref:Uncharacterized protein n=1 Tax=Gregarina niphandrodes TaxID=110365 RepID=A0A023BCZ7_GRENI|nr:hypothetical protein GNI_010560 [Gregarina niphandrodes]EZG86251.1 hypothetical protein GNI_010560 [Gregarina niphandrodes]|eukprot:XP_011128771.1 hypothetical protein GNI_010560 [Gregarina niphandrodes]
MAVVGSVIRMMASFSQSQKQREPRVIFNSVRNEVMLGATEKGSKGKIVVKLYPNGIPRPPVRYSQEYFVSCLNDTFVYFLQQRGNGIINGEMCMYIVRMALVTASMDLQAKQEAVQLSEIPEKDFTKFVDNLKREQFEKQKEEMLRLQKLQRELDAYFSGRDMTARQEQVPEEKQVINTPGGVSLPALFEASTLKQTLPLPDFYALLYQLRQSKEDPGHFDRYRVIKFIHDRQRLEAVTEKWNELSTLNTALAAARDNDSISIEPQAIQQLNVDIDKFKAHLQLLEKTLEYSIFRSLDFATILMAVEDTGNDPLDRRIEPLTQNRYQLTEPTSPMSFGSSASEMNLSPEDLR